MIKTVEISRIEELIHALNELPNHYIYRGHANAEWPLQSSLERVLGSKWSADSVQKFEEYSLGEFRAKFHLYDRENLQPGSKLAWLSLMQHYGVPTRLLDFTESPYVALYFAMEAYDVRSGKDLAVIAIDYRGVMQRSIDHISRSNPDFSETRLSVYKRQDAIFEDVLDKRPYNVAWVTEPKQLNVRLDRQVGSFLLTGNPDVNIEDVLASELYEGANITKYKLASALYERMFALLRKMNVTSKSLYGDLDGLARSIKMQMQIYSI